MTTGLNMFKVIVQGGPLNDHDESAEREMELHAAVEELPPFLAAIPAEGGMLLVPPIDPPPGIGRYEHLNASLYVWKTGD